MSMQIERKPVPITHSLRREVAQPIIAEFLKNLGIKDTNISLKNKDLEFLNVPFAEIYSIFRKVREDASEYDFADFLRQATKALGWQEQVKCFLTRNAGKIIITAHSNSEPQSEDSFINTDDLARAAKGPLIAIQVGNYVQSFKISDVQFYTSQLVPILSSEDTTQMFDAVICLSTSKPEIKKTNRFARFFLPLFVLFKQSVHGLSVQKLEL